MFEGPQNSENVEVSKNEVVESLKNNPEDLSILHKFLDKKEAEVKNSSDALGLNIEIAEIYRDAGLLDDAHEAFLDARDQAIQEGDNELAERLDTEAIKLRLESLRDLEEGEAVVEGQCSVCNWSGKRIFEIGDDERDRAYGLLEEKHEATGCNNELTFIEKGRDS